MIQVCSVYKTQNELKPDTAVHKQEVLFTTQKQALKKVKNCQPNRQSKQYRGSWTEKDWEIITQ